MKEQHVVDVVDIRHGNPKSQAYRAVSAALFYAFMSVSTVFLNKAIFRIHKFKFPATLVAGQMAFTLLAVVLLQQAGVVRRFHFSMPHFKRVGWLSFFFVLKLLLDMSALAVVNIPMYGVLKSSTTPCVLMLDYFLRGKTASKRVVGAVAVITVGGMIAGLGDLTFDLWGYVLAIGSALSTAAYVVIVGKLGDELQFDSWMLLFYNCLWSLPLSMLLVVSTGEAARLLVYQGLTSVSFLLCFAASCGSALLLNWATYMCTLANDSLTTSVVGRTKSIVQTLGGLFAFGDVRINPLNLWGVGVNSLGIAWYTLEKALEHRRREARVERTMQEEKKQNEEARGAELTPRAMGGRPGLTLR